MKALITGAQGFVGGYLGEHLHESGDEIIACGISGPNAIDVTDLDRVRSLFTQHRPDVVYHLAALTHVGESWIDPNEVLRVNVEGTVNVLNAAREAEVGRILVIGSAEEYGRAGTEERRPLREDDPLLPMSPYGASKVAASYLALQAFLGTGLPVVRVRPFNHTGPGQSARFLVPALAKRVADAEAAGADEIHVGATSPVREINDVRDIVIAYRILALTGEPGDVYNVCSGHAVTVAEVADQLAARAKRPLQVTVDPDLVRPVDVPYLVGDPTKVNTTGWTPRHTLDDTLDEVLHTARSHV
jgi:GDP-4-dehydro-6-deoxy-D-mannose reductase